jgi:hypothetical protein
MESKYCDQLTERREKKTDSLRREKSSQPEKVIPAIPLVRSMGTVL